MNTKCIYRLSKFASRSRLLLALTLSGSALCLMVASQLLNAPPQPASASITVNSQSTTALHGSAALERLKQQGAYDSLAAAMAATRYQLNWVTDAALPGLGSAWCAPNPAQGLSAYFTPEGVRLVERQAQNERARPRTPAWQVNLKLVGYGRGERAAPVAARELSAANNRVEIRQAVGQQTAVITEWYINQAAGLEQGFTLSAPPAQLSPASQGEQLRLTLRLSGDLHATLAEGGQALWLTDQRGKQVLSYSKLAAWDARGQPLAARMRLQGQEVALEVDDASAVYPVTIDPTFAQQAYVKASNTGFFDSFGAAIALAGDTVVVGAPSEASWATGVNGDQSDNSAPEAGAAYVFVRNAGVWSQQAYLKASNTDWYDYFGTSVAISGDTVVVGAYGESSNATGVNGDQSDNSAVYAGAAYVFVRNAGVWSQQAYLKASNTGEGDAFGADVVVSGDTVVVGAYGEASNATGINGDQNNNLADRSGAAYVFVRNAGVWSQQAYLKASNTGERDGFGSLALAGDTLVVGATWEDSNATGINGDQHNNSTDEAGAAYVFVRNAGGWSQQAYLKASNTDVHDWFGSSVAVSGDTVVVAAPFESSNATGINGDQSNNLALWAGAAYVFVRNAGVWSQQAYLKASNTGADDRFGSSVSVSGNTAVVGADHEDSNATGVNGDQDNNSVQDSGAAYVFARNAGVWSQQAALHKSPILHKSVRVCTSGQCESKEINGLI